MTQERASIESCRAAIGTHDEDGMVEIEASILEDALDYLESENAAREKRMREVAEEMKRVGEGHPPLWATAKNLPDAIRVWAAKLLEGIKKEDAET